MLTIHIKSYYIMHYLLSIALATTDVEILVFRLLFIEDPEPQYDNYVFDLKRKIQATHKVV